MAGERGGAPGALYPPMHSLSDSLASRGGSVAATPRSLGNYSMLSAVDGAETPAGGASDLSFMHMPSPVQPRREYTSRALSTKLLTPDGQVDTSFSRRRGGLDDTLTSQQSTPTRASGSIAGGRGPEPRRSALLTPDGQVDTSFSRLQGSRYDVLSSRHNTPTRLPGRLSAGPGTPLGTSGLATPTAASFFQERQRAALGRTPQGMTETAPEQSGDSTLPSRISRTLQLLEPDGANVQIDVGSAAPAPHEGLGELQRPHGTGLDASHIPMSTSMSAGLGGHLGLNDTYGESAFTHGGAPSMSMSMSMSGPTPRDGYKSSLFAGRDDSVVLSRLETPLMGGSTVSRGRDGPTIVESFATAFQRLDGSPFDRAALYTQECTHRIQSIDQELTLAGTKFERQVLELKLLELERNTWLLLRRVFKDSFETGTAGTPMSVLGIGETDRNIVAESLRCDASLRHAHLVVKWLQETENLHVQDSLMDVPCYVPQHTYSRDSLQQRHATWADSLHKMKSKRRGTADHFHVDRDTVDAMDPDAPRRTGRPLTSEDQDDEQRLMDKLFSLVRTGNIDKAKDLCRQSGQSWRAATLSGWEYWHDPNCGRDVTSEDVQGNAFRDVFKAACFAMSNDAQNSDVHERALYAALSGNLARLLPVCKKWEDALWAHYTVMLDVGIENKLRSHPHPSRPPAAELPEWYVKQDLDPETIFGALDTSPTDGVRDGAQEPYHVMQALIIQDDVVRLVTQAHAWVSDLPPEQVRPYYRFLAHLVLFFRDLGVPGLPKDLCNDIILTYVKHLIEMKAVNVIATYTARLPHAQQVQTYALFLRGISNKVEQRNCLLLARDAGLPVAEIAKTVVEVIRDTPDEQASLLEKGVGSGLDQTINLPSSTVDRQKIDAIDWLVFNPSHRGEALIQSNAVVREFLSARKFEAAAEVFAKIPKDSPSVVLREWQRVHGEEDMDPALQNACREYLGVTAFLDAQRAYEIWLRQRDQQPTPPESDGDEGGRPAYMTQMQHEQQQYLYNQRLQRWQETATDLAGKAKKKIENVLLFPEGWLVDTMVALGEDKRQEQLALLRKIYVPELCIMDHHVLHEQGEYDACIRLADMIVCSEENSRLLEVFRERPGELRKLLGLIRASALKILEEHPECSDPLAYE